MKKRTEVFHFFPWSVSSQVKKFQSAWRNNNEVRKKEKYNFLERNIITSSAHPIRNAIYLFASYLFIAIIFEKYVFPDVFLKYNDLFSESNIISLVVGMLGVQTTLVALVFPILIAFVAMLLYQRPYAKAYLQIYLVVSGGSAASISSLALILFLASQILLLPYFTQWYLSAVIFLSTIWFIYNVLLTIRFIIFTVQFLRPDYQTNVITRYVVNISYPCEAGNFILQAILNEAAGTGRIHERLDISKPNNLNENIIFSYAFTNYGEKQVSINLKKLSRLENVYYWPLRQIVDNWIKDNFHSKLDDGVDADNQPKLYFPSILGWDYEGNTCLVRTESSAPISGFYKKLAGFAFKFRKIGPIKPILTTKHILSDLESDINQSIVRGDEAAFNESYNRTINLHLILVEASDFYNSEGELENVAFLEGGPDYNHMQLYEIWVNTYKSIGAESIGQIRNNTYFANRLCNLSLRLAPRVINKNSLRIYVSILKVGKYFLYKLGNWWVKEVEVQGNYHHDVNNYAELSKPLYSTYDEVLRSFVGGWESAHERVSALLFKKSKIKWEYLQDCINYNAEKLEINALMFVEAVYRGDKSAAEWTWDMMLKSKIGIGLNIHIPLLLREKSDFITLSTIKQSWENVERELGIDDYDHEPVENWQLGVFLIGIRNYKQDLVSILCEILISKILESGAANRDKSLAFIMLLKLITLSSDKDTRGVGHGQAGFSAEAYFRKKIRQAVWYRPAVGQYGAELDTFIEKINDLERNMKIPGRIYSFSGHDMDSLNMFNLVLLSVYSRRVWSDSLSLTTDFIRWADTHFNTMSELKSYVEKLINKLEELNTTKTLGWIDIIKKKLEDSNSAAEGVEYLKLSLGNIFAEIEKIVNTTIAASDIDDSIIESIAVAASNNAFSQSNGQFPIQLFRVKEFTQVADTPHMLRFANIPKVKFTLQANTSGINFDYEVYERHYKEYVAQTIFLDVVSKCEKISLIAKTPKEYWEALKLHASKMYEAKLQPILVLDNRTHPEWIWDWLHTHEGSDNPRPTDLIIRHNPPENSSGYVADFNGIPVYVCPALSVGSSILLPLEVFSYLGIKSYGDEKFAKAEIKDSDQSGLYVDLELTFESKISVGNNALIEIKYDI